VKHGVKVSVVNFYTDDVGNPELPAKFKKSAAELALSAARDAARLKTAGAEAKRPSGRKKVLSFVAALIALGAIAWLLGQKAGTQPRGTREVDQSANVTSNRTAPSVIPEKSVAVLPFESLSSDKENAYFADGMQDQILTDLAKIADLKVISRTSMMQYKGGAPRNLREIGQQLGVAHLLEGSVQRAAGKVRVNPQLIDARTDAHLWEQVYDRPLNDIFAIQTEIAEAIADQLRAKLSPTEKAGIEKPPTSDLAAFDLYSRAKTLLLSSSYGFNAEERLLEALDLLNQAISRDPSFFEAYCLLAYTHNHFYFLGKDHTPARLALAEAAIDRAFELRPDAGEAHLARAGNLFRGHLDYDGALRELEIAGRTLPNNPRIFELTGYIARRQGKQEEALRQLERALELDPRNFITLQQIGLSYQNLRRYREMAGILERSLAIKPDDVDTRMTRGYLELDWKADTRLLHQTIEAVLVEDPSMMRSIADYWLWCALAERDAAAAERALVAMGRNGASNNAVLLSHDFMEGLVAQMNRDENRARAAFTAARIEQEKKVQAQPDYGPALCVLGLIDAALGRKEEALRAGRRAVELLPVAKDSVNGANMIAYLAMIAGWVGDVDLACEQLAIATRLPGPLGYGQLKLLPYWDPLRGDPRFEQIVARAQPANN